MSKICCIIPVFNAAKYIERTLQSVYAQTRKPDEIVAVNDGSTDDSLAILKKYKSDIRILTIPHQGVGTALNAGIMNSESEVITFIDSDDLWAENKLELQLAALESSPETDAIFSLVQQFLNEEYSSDDYSSLKNNVQSALPGISKLTLMMKRSTFLKVGYFNEELERGDFIEWFSRFKHVGLTYEIVDEVLAYRRLRSNSLSANLTAEKDFAKVMKMHLDRKRSNI